MCTEGVTSALSSSDSELGVSFKTCIIIIAGILLILEQVSPTRLISNPLRGDVSLMTTDCEWYLQNAAFLDLRLSFWSEFTSCLTFWSEFTSCLTFWSELSSHYCYSYCIISLISFLSILSAMTVQQVFLLHLLTVDTDLYLFHFTH